MKNNENYVFLRFSKIFSVFLLFFIGFSIDFCKGRISPNILQISPKSAKIAPLRIFSVLAPGEAGLKSQHLLPCYLGVLLLGSIWDFQGLMRELKVTFTS